MLNVAIRRTLQLRKLQCKTLQNCAKLCKIVQNCAALLCAKGCLELQSPFFVCMKSFKPWKSFLHHRKLFELTIIAIAVLTIFILTENTDLFIEILLIKMYMVCSASILAIRIAHLKGQLDVIEGQGEGLQAEQYRRPETIYQMKVRIQRYHLQKAKCKMMWENRFPVRYEDNFDNNLFARILTDFERTRTR